MKNFKNIIRMTMVALAAMVVSACEPNNDEQSNGNLILTVDVENITATSAKIKVSHSCNLSDSWYGFLTTDVKTNEITLIKEVVANLSKDNLASELKFSKSFVTVLDTLVPTTSYKYIAFGLTENGEIYGTHGAVEFTTTAGGGNSDNSGEDEVYPGMNVNPAWSVKYTGAGVINDINYNHTVTVTSTDNNPYTIVTVYASEYNPSYLRDLGELLVEDMYSYLESYNSAYGTSFVLNDLLYRGSGATAFDNLDPGYYIAVALGITSKGEVSGLYAVSSTFHIEEEAPTSLYMGWLGDWTFKGDNNISNDVIIARKVANKTINLIGLQRLPFSVVGDYSIERNDIIFYAQVVEQGYQFSDGTVGDIHLIGLDKDGKTYGLDNGNYGIAIAGVPENGYRAIVRYGVNQPNYPKFNAMLLSAFVNGEYFSIGENIPSFNGIAELAPLDSAGTRVTSSAAMHYMMGKSRIESIKRPLVLGKRIETVHF